MAGAGEAIHHHLRLGAGDHFIAIEGEAINRLVGGRVQRALVETNGGAAFDLADREAFGGDGLVILAHAHDRDALMGHILVRVAGDEEITIGAHGDMARAFADTRMHDRGVKALGQDQVVIAVSSLGNLGGGAKRQNKSRSSNHALRHLFIRSICGPGSGRPARL